MKDSTTDQRPRVLHSVWDRTTRWFHWINVVCILLLMALGTAILNKGDFGVGTEGSVMLKTLHVYVGYVFVLNLIWRLVWAFAGNAHARWKAFLPFRSGFFSELRTFLRGFNQGKVKADPGHNPLGRLMVTLLLTLMFVQASTGLILAGTDVYMPPFGGIMEEWVTGGDSEKLANLKPGSKEFVVPEKYDEMRAFRKPFIETHKILFYVLLGAILLHIAGVVIAEFRLKQGLVSGMITGKKSLPVHESQNDD